MNPNDIRKEYLFKICSNFFRGFTLDKLFLEHDDDQILNAFLNETSFLALVISNNGDKLSFKRNVKLLTKQEKTRSLVFCKTRPEKIDEKNVENVLVLSVTDTPAETIYNALNQLYVPLLESQHFEVGQQMQALVEELGASQENSSMRKSSVLEEMEYWENIANSSDNLDSKRAKIFYEILAPLAYYFQNLDGASMNDLLDISEKTKNVLDDLWRITEVKFYPEDRMKNMLTVVAQEFQNAIQYTLRTADLWHENTPVLEDLISEAKGVCKDWIKNCEVLSGHFWKTSAERRWHANVYIPNNLVELMTRLDEIYKVQLTIDKTANLLTPIEKNDLDFDKLLKNLSASKSLGLTPIGSQMWKGALLEFDKKFINAEKLIAQKLRQKFVTLEKNPLQLFLEFEKYADLLSRPNVCSEMQFEREKLISQFLVLIEEEKLNINDIRNDKIIHKTKNYSNFVLKLIELQKIEMKLSNASRLSGILLQNLGRSRDFEKQLNSLLEEVNSTKQDLFMDWSRDAQDFFKESLKIKGKLLELNSQNGKLEVLFGEKLIILLREVRTLTCMGFVLPKNMHQQLKEGQDFYKYGIVLKQIAHFYNTVDQQIIPCQQPMMLGSALAFEKLIKFHREGTSEKIWSNSIELEEYVNMLEQAAQRFMRDIKDLRKIHTLVHEKVSILISTDLAKKLPMWKSELNEIRKMMNSLVNQGFLQENMKLWKYHWDIQLYKALEHQYQRGIVTLNEVMPEFKVDLIYNFSSHQISFRPPIEELRAKYFRELRKFCNIPYAFKGVGDNAGDGMFINISEKSSEMLARCFSQTAQIFNNLEKVPSNFRSWIALGCINLEETAWNALQNVTDWEQNFKFLKVKSKDIDKIPNEINIGCVLINIIPLKLSIEEHVQHLFDALITSLKKSIFAHMSTIEHFINSGSEMFVQNLQNVDEINMMNKKHIELLKDMQKVQDIFKEIYSKNKLLISSAGVGVDTIKDLRIRWDRFEDTSRSHEEKLKNEMEVLKNISISKCDEFEQEVEKFIKKLFVFKSKDGKDNEHYSLANIEDLMEISMDFNDIKSRKRALELECQLFGIDPPKLNSYANIERDMEITSSLLNTLLEFQNELKKFEEEPWITFRSKYFSFDTFLDQWLDKFELSKDSTHIAGVVKEINFYKEELIPILKWVRGDAFSEENWSEMFSLMDLPNYERIKITDLKFGNVLQQSHQIVARMDHIKELNSKAQSEIVIRDALKELEAWGSGAMFSLAQAENNSQHNISFIKDWKDLFTRVGENQSIVQSLKNSPHYKYFHEKVTQWETKISDLDVILHNLNQIQRRWVYLEPVFIKGALKKEEGRFKKIDDEFRKLMNDIKRDPKVISLLFKIGLKTSLTNMLDSLHRCQKTLLDYLENKRLSFPRFYFIGDDDLLEILGQANNPSVIQSHLKKLFSGINSVKLNKTCNYITSMVSLEGEVVPLKKEIKLEKEVELWLNILTKEMKSTLREMINQCLSQSGNELDSGSYPSQVLCLAEKVQFTHKCEISIERQNLRTLGTELREKLGYYTSMNAGLKNSEQISSSALEMKLKDLIYDTINHIDIVEMLQTNSVTSLGDWSWQKQLRFYNLQDGFCKIKMGDPEMKYTFEYTYEYQGNFPKLVHTPLTDKCYLTLTQAMSAGLGGAPYGPAGTGKTESVKALGGIFGRQVLVFNCDEGIDVKSMGRIFIGLVQCGAWGCFDEFNRLDEHVLSAISMQIQMIQDAIKNKNSSLNLLGKTVTVDRNAGIFITMNPASKDYGGRQKLPDNLKQLFRPVSMSHPDNELIAEVILFSEGFKDAKSLGRKIVTIFDLCRSLLSSQQHYDWGLRSIKSVLKSCGSLLVKVKKDSNDNTVGPKVEAQLVMQAIQMNTISKLTTSDKTLFQLLTRDIFVDVDFVEIENVDLYSNLEEVYKEQNFGILRSQMTKSIELLEQLKQRMGVLIVGPSGSGKSTLWKNLRQALVRSGQQVKLYVLNPKAMPKAQLLGQIDVDTREWIDGILTTFARQVIKEPREVTSWIICDGEIDPEWIESLNSVLDDNHLLTLPSGERIQLGSNVNFIFETHELGYASPATISRMGMLFLSEEDISVEAVVLRWLKSRPEDMRDMLQNWIDAYFYRLIDWVKKEGEFHLTASLLSAVQTGLYHVQNIQHLQQFIVGLFRGLSGNMTESSKKKFSEEIFAMLGEHPPDNKDILNFKFDETLQTIVRYGIKHEKEFMSSSNEEMGMVMTADVERFLDEISIHLGPDAYHPFIVLGPAGCGKRFLIEHCLENMNSSQLVVIHCSAHTSPKNLIQKLKQVCIIMSGSSGRTYKPRNSEKLVLLLKGINFPSMDKWGTSIFLAFLHQIITYKGFYDSGLEFVGLEGIQIVISLSIGISDLSTLSSRIISVMNVCSINYPHPEQLQVIYSSYLVSSIYPAFSKHVFWGKPSNVDLLSKSMITLSYEMHKNFNINDHCHYIFNLSHIAQWANNFSLYNLAEIASHSSSSNLLHVWFYEAACLFRSRLVGSNAKATFDQLINSVLENVWSTNTEKLFKDESVFVACTLDGAMLRKNKYLSRLSFESYETALFKVLSKYNKEFAEQTIAFYPEFLKQMAHIEKVLSKEESSLMILGRSGIGRKTCVKLVAYMLQLEIFTPKMNASYGLKNFKADLKNLVQLAAVENREFILMLEDFHIVELEFYEHLNGLLSEGDVSSLFSYEELEALASSLRDQHYSHGYQGNVFDFLSLRLKRNIRICFVMDWSNKDFVLTCKNNPVLLKMCSLHWVDDWDDAAALKLSESLICTKMNDVDKQSLNKSFLKMFFDIHNSIPQLPDILDNSPRKFITFLQTFDRIFVDKKAAIFARLQHLQKGLTKLQEAQLLVDELKKGAAIQHKELAEKQEEADNSMSQITSTLSTTGDKKIEMEELQRKAANESDQLEKRKTSIEAELAEIEPLILEAKAAVGSIRTETLGEIRALRAPPDTIRDILEGVMILMGNPDTSWLAMKSFLAKRGVKEEIQNFDARRISPETRKSIESLLKKNGSSFDLKNAKRASEAAAPLATWVTTNTKYAAILEKIQPLEREQQELQRNISSVENKMKKLSDGLHKVDVKVEELKKKFETLTRESATLKLKLEKTQQTIESAEALIGKLIEEFQRWTNQVKDLELEMETLHHKSLYAAAFLTYSSAIPENLRIEMKAKWEKCFKLKRFDVIKFLYSENEHLAWGVEGLASDELSLENALITCQSLLTPLIIDPSSRSMMWLVKHYSDSTVEVINSQDANLFSQVELAVRFGKILIIQEIDCIHPALVPLLRKDVLYQGSRKIIQIGEKLVDYNDGFCIYLTTRNPTPNLPSYIFSLFTIINFTTTKSGLTNQLLTLTILNERPELESQKTDLLRKEEDLTKQLSVLENLLLEELANAKGNILENKDLLESLEQMKQKSATISQSLKTSNELQESINSERNRYLPLAEIASRMFFAVEDLRLINHMYHFSLTSFLSLYNKLFKSQEHQISNTSESIKTLIGQLQYHVYNHYSRSLNKKDHLVFAMLLIYNTQSDLIGNEEWNIFIGLSDPSSVDGSENLVPDWVDVAQAPYLSLIKENLPELYSSLQLNDRSLWSAFGNNDKDEAKIPSRVSSKITKFQELLVIQALKPEWLSTYMASFACSVFDLKELSTPNLSIKQLYEKDSSPKEAILFILSQGADPSQELEDLAKKTIGPERYTQIALGQDQREKAVEALKSSASNGDWLCLKNLHLCISWLPTLENEIKSLEPHENFRLWLTSESHLKFPAVFLQSCLKVTYEAPAGIKRNLHRTYEAWGKDFINSSQNPSRAQALFRLAWFHAVVQERRSFLPQGWTKFYEFGQADLQLGSDILEKLFSKCNSGNIPWGFVQGLFEETVYGGRIDNIFDIQVLASYIQQFFSSNNMERVGPLELPQSTKYKDYVDLIESLPEFDRPSFFGLPENIETLHQKSISNEILRHLKTLKQFNIKNVKFDRALWSKQLIPLLNLWRKLESEHNVVRKKIDVALDPSCEDPVKNFLLLELQNALKLVQFISNSMLSLNKILDGEQTLSNEYYKLAISLINLQTPDIWLYKWNGPENPSEYMRNLINKAVAIGKLKKKADEGNFMGTGLNLAYFLRPDSFLNAFQQLSSRNLRISMDDMVLDCTWNNKFTSSQLFVRIEGLKLECCNFDGSTLSEKTSSEGILSNLPSCTLSWVSRQIFDERGKSVLPVPVYFNQRREGMVTKLYLPFSGDRNKWVQLRPSIFLE